MARKLIEERIKQNKELIKKKSMKKFFTALAAIAMLAVPAIAEDTDHQNGTFDNSGYSWTYFNGNTAEGVWPNWTVTYTEAFAENPGATLTFVLKKGDEVFKSGEARPNISGNTLLTEASFSVGPFDLENGDYTMVATFTVKGTTETITTTFKIDNTAPVYEFDFRITPSFDKEKDAETGVFKASYEFVLTGPEGEDLPEDGVVYNFSLGCLGHPNPLKIIDGTGTISTAGNDIDFTTASGAFSTEIEVGATLEYWLHTPSVTVNGKKAIVTSPGDGKWVVADVYETGVAGIEVENGDAQYFNVQGMRVANPDKGIYIVVKNGKAAKVVL